jgi:hypothetical protein
MGAKWRILKRMNNWHVCWWSPSPCAFNAPISWEFPSFESAVGFVNREIRKYSHKEI